MVLTRIFNKEKNYENMYVNAIEDAKEQAERERKEAILTKMIEDKKSEIRAKRSLEEKENKHDGLL